MNCPTCGEHLADGANFCEACGSALTADPSAATAEAVATPAADEASPISTPTVRPHDRVVAPLARVCAECGGQIDHDDYCTQCGTKAPSERDHFEENPEAWVAGVCDRGRSHPVNQDAMALFATSDPTPRAVLVVCDGVTNSDDSHVASLAGARAARDVLRTPLPKGMGTPASLEAAAEKVLGQAAEAAQTAVVANSNPSSEHPSSSTLVIGMVEGQTLRYAVIGDSRAYWLPDEGVGEQLLTDDSLAQRLMDAGTPRAEAEQDPQAHAITKWLGADSEDTSPRMGTREVSGDGWLLVCSDGLWNYASEPADLRREIDRAGTTVPLAVATALVAFANESGGRDNITVALARLGSVGDNAATQAAGTHAEGDR